MRDSLLDDLLKLCPRKYAAQAQLVARHGIADWRGCFRELISNSIDATLALDLPSHACPSVRIGHDGQCWSVSDDGVGLPRPASEILLQPAGTTKHAGGATIGQMGVGFLSVLSVVEWISVSTKEEHKAAHSFRLGSGPAPEPQIERGTTVRFALTGPAPQIEEVRRFLEAEFPFVSVRLELVKENGARDSVIAVPLPWQDPSDRSWLDRVRSALNLDAPIWTLREPSADGGAIIWVHSTPPAHARAGLYIFQNGVLLGEPTVLPPWFDRAAPPFLSVIVESRSVRPLITRKGVAAGREKVALIEAVDQLLHRALDFPDRALLEVIPKLQDGFGSAFMNFAGKLPKTHPLRLGTVWRTSRSRQKSMRLEAIAGHVESSLNLLVGDSEVEDFVWQDKAHSENDGALWVRVRDTTERDLVVESLRALHKAVTVLDASAPPDAIQTLPANRDVSVYAERLSRALAHDRVAVCPVSWNSTGIIGLTREATIVGTSTGILALDNGQDEMPDMADSGLLLHLNQSSRVVQELARSTKPEDAMERREALAVVAAASASNRLPLDLSTQLGDAMYELLRERRGSSVRTPRRHARVMLIAPFEATDLHTALAEVLSQEPWFAELVRADKDNITGELWPNVERYIRDADAYVCDVRNLNPNVLLELGYVLAHAPHRPRVLIGDRTCEIADLKGRLFLELPADNTLWVQFLREWLPRSGLDPSTLPAAEPYLEWAALHTTLREAIAPAVAACDPVAFALGPEPRFVQGSGSELPLLQAAHREFQSVRNRFKGARRLLQTIAKN